MNKTFAALAMAAAATAASAADYRDKLSVTIGGSSPVEQQAVISVDKETDGTYRLSLRNFSLSMGGETMYVGDVVIGPIKPAEAAGGVWLGAEKTITIAEGAEPAGAYWMGPMIGEVPVSLRALEKDGRLRAVIDIDMAGAGKVAVEFGDGYQLPNPGFESFHKASMGNSESDEPDGWHSFMSCTGSLAGIVGGTPHTFISNDTRPGSAGSRSVCIASGKVLGLVVANGTLTTGRLTAGAMSASDPGNHSFLDLSHADKDANGDPFYATLAARPDSLAAWVRFEQGTPSAAFPYATVSAVVTDGTRYQEPEDKEYTNVAAKAADRQIAATGGQWKRISMPFDYGSFASNGAEAKAILVTMSTNAGAGKGSGSDSLYVDDMELVYNAGLKSLSVAGKPLAGFSPGVYDYEVKAAGLSAGDISAEVEGCGAFAVTEIEGGKAVVTVVSADLKKAVKYTIAYGGKAPTGISAAVVETSAGDVYDLRGIKVDGAAPKGFYIMRSAGGKAVKVAR